MGTVENLPAAAAWDLLNSEPDAQIIDVRTRAEWTFVGIPDLSSAGRQPVLLEWQVFPSMEVTPGFADTLDKALAEKQVPADAPLLFLCRSGGRSMAAAQAMSAHRGGRLINISDGFEGPTDAEGHRGTVAGWKASGLPWRQG
ncbi:rhodanese-like domain-containing protein [Futiania mangrovi]|uniref:Rhodanese-like domain-containing protein n=1 Tax=Futiania mangrovi TaxID=2959716 RepID=A0A9J6PB99_9PROT|nr:rhodanese-like domain-containing protein [Futiania mangrovii]MCP1336453.1 rhodanese-like domain-containing protein [Futiania mangrovii]